MSSNPQPVPTGPPQAGGSGPGRDGNDKRKRPRKRGGNKGKNQPNVNDDASKQNNNTANNSNLDNNRKSGEKKKPNNRRRKKNNVKDKDDQTNASKGNKSKAAKDTQAQNQTKKPQETKPPPPTKEELAKLAEEKSQAVREAATLKAQAEEAKRIEELKKQQTDLEAIFSERVSNLTIFVDTTIQKINVRAEMQLEEVSKRQVAFQNDKKKLKSDLKKCTAFCKKIKATQSFDDTVVKSLLKDVDTLNLTRYLDEIANAFLDHTGTASSSSIRRLKVVDVPGIVKVLISLHQRYKDFIAEILLPEMLRCFKGKASSLEAKQKRIYMRILTELLSLGVLTEPKPIMKIVTEAAGAPKGDSAEDREETYFVTDPNMLVSFAKAAGHELTGVVPTGILQDVDFILEQEKRSEEAKVKEQHLGKTEDKKQQDSTDADLGDESEATDDAQITTDKDSQVKDPETRESDDDKLIVVPAALIAEGKKTIERLNSVVNARAVSDEVCVRFKKHLMGALQCLSLSFVSTHKKLLRMEKRCAEDRLLAGSLTEQREKALIDARNLLESLRKSVETLSEALNKKIPTLQKEKEEEKEDTVTGLEVYKEDGRDIKLGPFDDEETRAFYCDIPDLLTTIPPTLLGYSAEDVEKIQEEIAKKYGTGEDQGEERDDLVATDEDGVSEKDFDDEEDATVDHEVESKKEDNDCENKDTPHYKLMVLIEEELPECSRRDTIDALADKFCTNHGATKNARKRIEKAMFLVPRSRLDLIPYYSRLAAIFDRVFPDISAPLVTNLEQQFHGLTRWKKQQKIDSRIRNARFIGELTKFKVAPPIVALRCLRRCIQDFSGYNIDIACCLLESCGRYLHRTKHTSAKLTQIMDTMIRIRKAKHFDERAVELMKSAFYMVQPPQRKVVKKVKILQPIEAYLKDLLLVRVDRTNVLFVSKQLLRLPWGDPTVDYAALMIKYMLKACRKGRYNSIHAVASLASSMKKSKPEILARIIDALLEELQYIMENPNIRDQQRAIVYAKLLGELYSYALVSSEAIFDQLYKFVDYDHHIPDSIRNASSNEAPEESSLPFALKSSLGVSGAIVEDEEMEDEDDSKNEDTVEENTADNMPTPVAVSSHSRYDPRVPSALDPPSAVFRIKLICTLLDNCASSLVTTSTFSKLEKFLAAFQRYLFIKDTLPTDIEFSLLDTFDLLESSLKIAKKNNKHGTIFRYTSWLEVHNTVVATEESEAIIQDKVRTRLLAQAGVLSDTSENQDLIYGTSDDDLSMNSIEDEQSVDNSEEGISDEEISVDEEDSEDSERSDDDGYEDERDADEAAEDEAALQRRLEDKLFEQEIRKLTMDALEKGKNSARTLATAKVSQTMPSASQFIRSKHTSTDTLPKGEMGTPGIFALGGADGMSFQLIKRGRKGRAETKSLVVPTDTNLAKVATRYDSEAVRERDILKARVLRYEAESAAQAYSGDVYMDQRHLPEVRNQSLRNIDIDQQFGRSTRSSYARGQGPYGGRGNIGGRGLKRF